MKWYGREANNRYDPKMVKLFDRYKCEGWTVYWTVLDMIAEKLDANHYTFCLEEETQYISKFLELTIEKVDAILNYCVELGLLDREPQSKQIRCLKIMSRLDDTTSRIPEIRNLIRQAKRFEETSKLLRAPTYVPTYLPTDLPAGKMYPSAEELFEIERLKSQKGKTA